MICMSVWSARLSDWQKFFFFHTYFFRLFFFFNVRWVFARAFGCTTVQNVQRADMFRAFSANCPRKKYPKKTCARSLRVWLYLVCFILILCKIANNKTQFKQTFRVFLRSVKQRTFRLQILNPKKKSQTHFLIAFVFDRFVGIVFLLYFHSFLHKWRFINSRRV